MSIIDVAALIFKVCANFPEEQGHVGKSDAEVLALHTEQREQRKHSQVSARIINEAGRKLYEAWYWRRGHGKVPILSPLGENIVNMRRKQLGLNESAAAEPKAPRKPRQLRELMQTATLLLLVEGHG